MPSGSTRRIRFADFEANLSLGELRKAGHPVRLQDQPFRILKCLLERPGDIVTREELRQRIWGEEVYVDFDRSLNTSVARLREALGDSPTRPVFVETVPRKGYRFIGLIESPAEPSVSPPTPDEPDRRLRTAGYAVALVGVFAAAIFFGPSWLTPEEAAKPNDPLAATPLTNYRGIENEASFSPDGSQFAFTWNGDAQDNFDVYVRTVEGQNLVRLTDDPARELSPAWSPDGQWIAYGRQVGNDRVAILRQSPLSGREEELLQILGPVQWAGSRIASSKLLAWMPDSRRIVVSHRAMNGKTALHLFNLETGNLRQLTDPEPPWSDYDPAVAPDARSLAFTRQNHSNISGYVLPLSENFEPNGQPARVTPRNGFVAPAWLPTGDRLLFSGPIQRPGIWLADPSSDDRPKPIAVEAGVRAILPAIRPDGKLAVTSVSAEMNIWRIDLRGKSGRLESQELIGSTAGDMLPAYSPDGQKIVFFSARGIWHGNWVANGDGSNPVQFLDCAASRWSPDGAQVVCDATAPGENRHGDIWLANAVGGPMRQMTQAEANDRMPNWSRDGKWIYFSSDRSGVNQIWKMPADGQESDAVQVTTDGGFFATESFDSSILYYTRSDEKGLWRLPLDGGAEEKFVDALVEFADYGIARDGVYYAAAGAESPAGAIYFYRFDDETTTVVFRPEKRFGIGLDVSPDGRYILYTRFDREESDLVLLEGLQ